MTRDDERDARGHAASAAPERATTTAAANADAASDRVLARLRDAGAHLRTERAPATLQARLERAYATHNRARDSIRPSTTLAVRGWAAGLATACGVAAVIALAPWQAPDERTPGAPAIAPSIAPSVAEREHAAGMPVTGLPDTRRTHTPPSPARPLAAGARDTGNTSTSVNDAPRHATPTRTARPPQPDVLAALEVARPATPTSDQRARSSEPSERTARSLESTSADRLAQVLPPMPAEFQADAMAMNLGSLPSDPSTLRIATTAPSLPRTSGGMPRTYGLDAPSLPTLAPGIAPDMSPSTAPRTAPGMSPHTSPLKEAPAGEPASETPTELPPAQAVGATSMRAIAMSSAGADPNGSLFSSAASWHAYRTTTHRVTHHVTHHCTQETMT